MKRLLKKMWIIPISCLLVFSSIFTQHTVASPNNTSVVCVVEKIYDSPDAKQLTKSGEYLYLLEEEDKIILLEKDHNKSIFYSNSTIYGFAALNRTLIFSNGSRTTEGSVLFAVNFNNYSYPFIQSNVSCPTTGGSIPYIGIYNQFVYTANQELNFQIFNFTNVSRGERVGTVGLSNWHDRQVFVVSQFGFFAGDFEGGIFDLSINPTNPVLLCYTFKYDSTAESETTLKIWGRPAVSEEYLVVNNQARISSESTTPRTKTEYLFQIIPRLNSNSLGVIYEVPYVESKDFTHCGLIGNNILVVCGKDNTLSLFEISQKRDLTFLSEIPLGVNGLIEDLWQIKGTNNFYAADGRNGLLKLTFTVTRATSTSSRIPSFYLGFAILSIGGLVFLRRSKYSERLIFRSS